MAASHRKKIVDLLSSNGEMHSSEIFASLSEVNKETTKKELAKLKTDGEVVTPGGRSWYRLPIDTSTSTQTRPDEKLKQISSELRAADANQKTIDRLMNIYDGVLDRYETWVRDNVDSDTDFENQLLFMENFKWLTAIGDKLMKRWSLEHVGYDTNTRQAQEDAKAKTEERQKEVLKDATLEDTVNEVGHFHTDLKELWDNLPEKEKEKYTV